MENELKKALAAEQQKLEKALRACGYTIETIQFVSPYGLNIPRLVINARYLWEAEGCQDHIT
jgi:hypothetical protein